MNLDLILADADLRNELLDQLGAPASGLESLESLESARGFDRGALESSFESMARGVPGDPVLEAIVRRHGRPVLFIRQGAIAEPESDLWKGKIEAARADLEAVIPSIGRIEAAGHPSKEWLGTGWLVAPEVLVTNRHVAVEFGRNRGGGRFAFKRNPSGRRMAARIDFRQEHEQPESMVFRIPEILHVEEDDDDALDLAFLRVETVGEGGEALPPPVRLSAADPAFGQTVGAIGYAAWDGRRNDQGVMERIFQNFYNVKRLHPGEVMGAGQRLFNHDCSTLGGNSGSPLIDFATGEAVGIHFAGTFELENYAIKSTAIQQRMADLGIG